MKIFILGANIIGYSIAELFALANYEVFLIDPKEEDLREAARNIFSHLEMLEKKGKISNKEGIASRINFEKTLHLLKEADFIVEALENSNFKAEALKSFDEVCKEDSLFISCTSSVSELTRIIRRTHRLIGLHLFVPFNPKFAELIIHEKISEDSLRKAEELLKSLGIEYALVKKEIPGLIVNRIMTSIFLDSLKIVEEGYSYEEVDALVKFRLGFASGIFELADAIGIDTIYGILKQIEASEARISIPKNLEEMVTSNRLGIKTGRGFYEYGKKSVSKINMERIYKINPLRLLARSINEAARLIRNDVSSKEDIDNALDKGVGFIRILEYADEVGLDEVSKVLDELYKERNSEEYIKDPLISEMMIENKLGKKTGRGFYEWKYERLDIADLSYEKMHDYAVITLKRKEKLNALDEAMWKALSEAFEIASKDGEIMAVVIKGEGRAFSAGDDIEVMSKWKSLKEGKEFFEKALAPFVFKLLDYEKPVISLVNGIAYGGGCEINLLFDIVIASEEARFAVTEGLIGAIPPVASTIGIALVGRRMIRYCLTGESMNPWEAKELGLVDLVVPSNQLDIVAVEFLNKLRKVAPLSIKAMKKSINSMKDLFMNTLMIGAQELTMLVASEDFKEGMKAFLEKRKPIWKGV